MALESLRAELAALLRRPLTATALVAFVVTVALTSIRSNLGTGARGWTVLDWTFVAAEEHYLARLAAFALAAEGAAAMEFFGRRRVGWCSGRSTTRHFAAVAGRCAALAGLIGLLYLTARAISGVITLSINDVAVRVVPLHEATAPPGDVWRGVVGLFVLSVIGALLGTAIGRPVGAAAITAALLLPSLPLIRFVYNYAPGLLEVQAVLPGGALETLLDGNSGVTRAAGLDDLVRPRDPSVGAAVLAGWTAAALVLAWRATIPRAASEPARLSTLRLAGLSLALVAAIAGVLPRLTQEALPWRYQPEWLEAKLDGRATTQLAARFVDDLQRRDEPFVPFAGAVLSVRPDAPFWAPLRSADSVDVADETDMDRPEVVPVTILHRGSRLTYLFFYEDVDGDWRLGAVGARSDL